MTKRRRTRRALINSIISLLICFSMLIGTTFAWFTDSVTSANNIIKAGNLDVEVYYGDPDDMKSIQDIKTLFNDVTLWEPGAVAYENLTVANIGSLALKYQMSVNFMNENYLMDEANEKHGLSEILKVAVVPGGITGNTSNSEGREALIKTIDDWMPMSSFSKEGMLLPKDSDLVVSGATVGTDTYGIVIYWKPSENDDNWNVKNGKEVSDFNDTNKNELHIDLGVNLVATQLVAEDDSFGSDYDINAVIPWDGTVDTTWYNDTETEFVLDTAEQFAGLAELVDDGNTFEGKTIELNSDIDLYVEDENGEPIPFNPIGSYRNDTSFKGTFNGQGYTIKNLSQNTWALNNGYYYADCGLGLFGAVEGGTVKNLVVDNASISGESALCGTVAAVAQDATFENITVKNSEIADYQYYAGGIVGWASGELNFINCNVDTSTTVAGQWGDFDNSNGGVIGGASSSAKILLKDCKVACRIDAYNDVTSSYRWYAYRRSGMLIGNSGATTEIDGRTVAIAPQLTCENVTVVYDDWANYTYCEFAGTSWPYVRVQAGVSNSAYSNPRYGHPTDANGNAVVDDNHVHNDGEDHQILCAFDQLYGGGQGVYGGVTHEGVTVIYNNK